MYPYLLHQYPVAYFCNFLDATPGWPMWLIGKEGHYGWAFWLATVVATVCLIYLATLAPVRWVFGPVIEPDWLISRWDLQPKKKALCEKSEPSSAKRETPILLQSSETGAPTGTCSALA